MNEHVFFDFQRSIRDTLGRGEFRSRHFFCQVLADSYLIDKRRCKKLAKDLELKTVWGRKARRKVYVGGGETFGNDGGDLSSKFVDLFHRLERREDLLDVPEIYIYIYKHTFCRTKCFAQNSLVPPEYSYAPTTLNDLNTSLFPSPNALCVFIVSK